MNGTITVFGGYLDTKATAKFLNIALFDIKGAHDARTFDLVIELSFNELIFAVPGVGHLFDTAVQVLLDLANLLIPRRFVSGEHTVALGRHLAFAFGGRALDRGHLVCIVLVVVVVVVVEVNGYNGSENRRNR